MPLGLFSRILAETSPYVNSYNLHGMGESLLHPEFPEMVRQVKETGALCRVTTNGLLLVPDLAARLLEQRIDAITISLDAATPETYQQIRRSKGHAKVLSNIRALASLRRALALDRPSLAGAFVCT